MSYAQAHAFEREAAELGVSKVARAPKGFMREYEQAGPARAMRHRRLPAGVKGGSTWGQKRWAFINRFEAMYRRKESRAIFLALVMWAYDPRS